MGIFVGSRPSGKYTCSKCKGTGHNRRSCGKSAPPMSPPKDERVWAYQPGGPEPVSASDYTSLHDGFMAYRAGMQQSPATLGVLGRPSMFNPSNPDVVPMDEIEENAAGYIAYVKNNPETGAKEIENQTAEDAFFEKVEVITPPDPNPIYIFKVHTRRGESMSSRDKPISPRSLPPVDRAFYFSKDAHRGQVDKLGVPYFLHPQGVADCLEHLPEYQALSDIEKNDAKVAAYLHDVLEDTEYTRRDLITLGFSRSAIAAIEAVTAPKGMPKDEYYERVKAAGPVAVAVKLADLSHNNLQARRAQLPGAPGKPVPAGGEDQFTRLGKKYAKAYKALGSNVPEHLKPFRE
jgi:hypothetical protein